MSNELFMVLQRFIEVRRYDFVLTCGIVNRKYGTGFTVPELRKLYNAQRAASAVTS